MSSKFVLFNILIKILRQVRISSPEESNCIVAPENVLMHVMKQGAHSLGMKMQNAELHLKGATIIMHCSRLQQDYPH